MSQVDTTARVGVDQLVCDHTINPRRPAVARGLLDRFDVFLDTNTRLEIYRIS
jgi:hypothetical protein